MKRISVKKNFTQPLSLTAAVLLMIVFVLVPFPAAPLHIRLYFDEIAGDQCALYYTTDTAEGYSEERRVLSKIEAGGKVDFCLDASLAGHLTNLRIDWPNAEQLMCIKSVTASSAGVVQKEWNPCSFFSDIAMENDIADQSMVWIRNRAYLLTNAQDPYVVLGTGLVREIQGCYSHYRLTRLAVCLFLLGCFVSRRRELFAVSKEDV